MAYIAYGVAWLSTGAAVSIAIWITKSAAPLWAMLIPAFIQIEHKKNISEVPDTVIKEVR